MLLQPKTVNATQIIDMKNASINIKTSQCDVDKGCIKLATSESYYFKKLDNKQGVGRSVVQWILEGHGGSL